VKQITPKLRTPSDNKYLFHWFCESVISEVCCLVMLWVSYGALVKRLAGCVSLLKAWLWLEDPLLIWPLHMAVIGQFLTSYWLKASVPCHIGYSIALRAWELASPRDSHMRVKVRRKLHGFHYLDFKVKHHFCTSYLLHRLALFNKQG
jgi:hypothetical protein